MSNLRKDVQKFSKHPKEIYEGKEVKVGGVIELYKDRPQIIVREPRFIEVITTD